MFDILKKEGVKKVVIEKYFHMLVFKKTDDLKNIFDEKYVCEDMKQHIKNLRLYIRLKGLHNKVWKAEEIENFCLKRGISLEIFLQEIFLNGYSNKKLISLYIDKIKKGKSLYIGGSMKVSKKNMEKYAEKFMELSKSIALRFCNMTNERYTEDKQMEALHIIMDRCGNLIYNLSDNPKVLYGCIFNKIFKSLYLTVRKVNEVPISLTYPDGTQADIEYFDESYDQLEQDEQIEVNYQRLSKEEIEVVHCLENELEYSDKITDYSEIAKKLNKSEEEIKNIIIRVREKMSEEKEFER